MKKSVFSIIVFSILVLAYSPAFADGPADFDNKGINVTYENGEYFLTIPEIDIGDVEFWAKWKLNYNTIGWDFVGYGLTSDVKGEKSASGDYIYNSQKGVLIMEIDWSTFIECGVMVGTFVQFVSPITSTTMTWTDPDPQDADEIIWIRSSGTSGDITGTWSMSKESNTYSVTFNSDGSFTVVGNIGQCD
jgi:hypothetical protein